MRYRLIILCMFSLCELFAQRYYSRRIIDKLITAAPSGSTANVIAVPTGANPTPRKCAAMGSFTSLGAMTSASGITDLKVAKNNSNYLVGVTYNGGLSNANYTSNNGTSWSSVTGVATASRVAISSSANFAIFGRNTSTTRSGKYYVNFSQPWTPTAQSTFYLISPTTRKSLGFNSASATGAMNYDEGYTQNFTAPFASFNGDVTPTNATFWIARATGGHQIAWSTGNDTSGGGVAAWTTITISGSTTQSEPNIRVSNDDQKIFVVFNLSNAYSSIDGGSTWTGPFSLPTGFVWQTMAATNDLSTIVGIKSTANGTFYYSTDMGATWTEKVDAGVGVAFSAIVAWD